MNIFSVLIDFVVVLICKLHNKKHLVQFRDHGNFINILQLLPLQTESMPKSRYIYIS